MSEVDFKKFERIDLVAGGPLCQPFSMGGKAKGHRDGRDMFPEAVRAVRELKPSAFVFENVRGLLRSAFSNYVEFIRLQLSYPEFPVSNNLDWETNLRRLQRHHFSNQRKEELCYKVTLDLADAADYGVPQRRHRVFFVGFRSDLKTGWSFPSPTHSMDGLVEAKYVTGDYWASHLLKPSVSPDRLLSKVDNLRSEELFKTSSPWKTVRDALAGLPDPKASPGISNHRFQSGAKMIPGHTGSLLDEPAKALQAGDHGVPGGENMIRYANGRVRYFTVREAARLQTFPDTYYFPGSWTESMRQLGNAVPVGLARMVAQSIAAKIRPISLASTYLSPNT